MLMLRKTAMTTTITTLLILSVTTFLTFQFTYVNAQTQEGQNLEKIQSYIK